jgi:hypothetical protein
MGIAKLHAKHGGHMGKNRMLQRATGIEPPNPSIERTVSSGLRPLTTAAHVKR